MNPIIRSVSRTSCIGLAVASLALAGSTQAAVIFTVSDKRIDNAARTLTTSEGNITAPADIGGMVYTISNLDLTSVGGTATETIVFNVDFSSVGTSGTGVQFNTFGNVSITGTQDDQIDPGEALRMDLTLNTGLTTFNTSNISLAFTQIEVGGFNSGESELWTLGHDDGPETALDVKSVTGLSSSFLSIGDVFGDVNLSRYQIEITAVPEPSSTALIGLGGFALILRRRR